MTPPTQCPICDSKFELNDIVICRSMENMFVQTHYSFNGISGVERYRFYHNDSKFGLNNFHNLNTSRLTIYNNYYNLYGDPEDYEYDYIIPINKDTRNRLLNLKAFL